VRSEKAAEVSLDPKKLEEARNAVRLFRNAQESMEFPMRPGQQCARCPFFPDRCPGTLSPA
jgi:hypothetical protein